MNEVKNYELVKFVDCGFELEVNVSPKEETVWLTQEQMSILFEVDRTRITRHISNIFDEGELDYSSNVRKTHFTSKYKPVSYYSLNVIISVGYRVKSKRGVQFRIWANKVLKEYLLNGYVINESRTLVTNENYVRLINKVESMNERINIVENKLDSNIYNPKKVFVSGEYYDAYTYIQSLFQSANKVHDRFIIIDNLYLYHIGASLKDLGNKIFAIEKLDSLFIETIMNNL